MNDGRRVVVHLSLPLRRLCNNRLQLGTTTSYNHFDPRSYKRTHSSYEPESHRESSAPQTQRSNHACNHVNKRAKKCNFNNSAQITEESAEKRRYYGIFTNYTRTEPLHVTCVSGAASYVPCLHNYSKHSTCKSNTETSQCFVQWQE